MNRQADAQLPSRDSRVVEFFIPESIRSGASEQLARARTLVWASVLTGGILLGFAAPTNLLFGQPRVAALNAVAGVFCLGGAMLLRASGSIVLGSALTTGAAWLTLLVMYLGTSDGIPSALYSLAVLPLAATLLGGARAGIFWLVMVFVTVAGIQLAGTLGVTVPIPALEAQSRSELFMMRDVAMLAGVIGVIGIYYDRQRGNAVREAQLERSRAKASEVRFERAFASNPDAIAIWEAQSDRVIECNAGFLRAVGLRREEVIGQLHWCREYGIEGEQRVELLEAIASSERGHTFEATSHQRPDRRENGSRIHLVSATTIEVDGSSCVLATARDVTEQRELDAQLRQAQKMEAVGQLAGSVAHDFNNMLTVILGYSSELKGRIGGPEGEEIDNIDRAARRAAALTDQLLTFSRREVVQPRTLELHDAIRTVSSMIRRLLGANVEVQLDLAPAEIHVLADAGQVDQVIVNLAINARDAMQDGGILTIRTETDVVPPAHPGRSATIAAPRGWCAIHVVDTGCGMEDAILSRATEPFFTTKPQGSGTGLGLSTVHGIVSQNGGEFRLASRAGLGTTATVYLPQIDGVGRSSDAKRPEPTTADFTESTILLVEDEELVRQLAHKILARAGHRVLSAADGAEALELARSCPHDLDLVVTDVVMPRMNGIALASALSAEWPDLPILFMSGYADPSFSGDTELPEGGAFIAKPFTGKALVDRTSRLLRSRTS